MSSAQIAFETLVLRAALGLPERVQRALLRRPVVIDGQTLAAETQMMLKLQALTKQPGLGMLPDLQANREQVITQGGMVGGKQPIGAVRDLTVDGGDGPIAARLFIPTARLRDDQVPTLLFIHGGGHGLGAIDSHDGACRVLAEESGVQVLSVEYRLAPEHPFPAAVDDCFAAYQWLVKNADSINADTTRLAVGGDSAGGNLSASTALQAAEAGLPMAFQLLIYPVTDFVNRSRSRELFDGGGFFLEKPGMDKLHRWYLPDAAQDTHPLASVLLRTEFPPGLAPAFVATAGFDPLRDEGEAYARLLAEHGVQVELKRYPAMIHGFFNIVGAGRECRANALDIADRLKAAIG
ncbi:alpha/beta hydrolase [Nocardioides marmorisolisilvae]|uniref:Alpha/beta hydrolase n=1 Tax=Nocardioides marmorisolisilvae TaxID=1542737 RepID=A0A3N0DPF6_9ACTN|nr:alpha/beta hydrolase [Nocardioides marmorisolisilvae]RNL77515.1 alpha/beta hydrolase [Nocardioides marmorisolisilvae]